MTDNELIDLAMRCMHDCEKCGFFAPCGEKGEVACLKAQMAYKAYRLRMSTPEELRNLNK